MRARLLPLMSLRPGWKDAVRCSKALSLYSHVLLTWAWYQQVDEEEVEESQSSTAALLSASRPDTPRGLGGIVRGVRGFFKRSCFRESMIIA